MRNGTGGPVRVTRAESFLACQGGWIAMSLGETIAKEGKFFGNDPVLTPGEYSYEFAYRHSTPVSHYLLALQLTRPGHPPHDYLLQVPFVRPGFAAPSPLHASAPVFIGLAGADRGASRWPTGEVWLPIVGQVINTSGRPMTLKTWKIRVKDAAGKVEPRPRPLQGVPRRGEQGVDQRIPLRASSCRGSSARARSRSTPRPTWAAAVA